MSTDAPSLDTIIVSARKVLGVVEEAEGRERLLSVELQEIIGLELQGTRHTLHDKVSQLSALVHISYNLEWEKMRMGGKGEEAKRFEIKYRILEGRDFLRPHVRSVHGLVIRLFPRHLSAKINTLLMVGTTQGQLSAYLPIRNLSDESEAGRGSRQHTGK